VIYLLDTVTVSETVKDRPDGNVIRWLRSIDDSLLHISALTLGELISGVLRMPAGKRRSRIETWIENDLPAWFGSRVLAADHAVCRRWGMLKAMDPNAPMTDSLIAATALCMV